MDIMWVKTSRIIKWIFSGLVWEIPNPDNKIFLTFDDGPMPGITDFVLDELKKNNIQATFFCIGKNVEAYPDLFLRILNEGHSVGNHTQNHLKGWDQSLEKYLENARECHDLLENLSCKKPKLFRPPYGKIKFSQIKALKKTGYKIIMWDVLSVDYNAKVSPEKCLDNVVKNTQKGSIIVFHDSLKAATNVKFALPKAIEILKRKGFIFDKI
ncbi:polysaccharide deacetylase family protein [Flavobacterium sp. NST-5]|uniref:Polysaccharide deacetylase family protein n=1 Tax=Flavobacterium ichthyis TaxID=2698827 RepID=A0ABW9Z5D6_9FLAO|nr:polysaccharide deacetylase family protein [Flavobacterium ichthyis]NBL63772.1 polysaccharide deacetylase family protein [Flavobacterium ichthyis]